jgi:superoxide dismutase, Cu-Zn family
MLKQFITRCLPTGVLLVGCQSQDSSAATYEDPGAEDPVVVDHAIAVIHPTRGNDVRGTVRFTRVNGGVDVRTELRGLPPGAHAYHVHLFGDCSGPDAMSAGTHFNFHGPSKHPPKDIQHITGDLGELTADASGNASAEHHIDDIELTGRFSILGRSVIVHERGNDPEHPPLGAAGDRLGCGVIGIQD